MGLGVISLAAMRYDKVKTPGKVNCHCLSPGMAQPLDLSQLGRVRSSLTCCSTTARRSFGNSPSEYSPPSRKRLRPWGARVLQPGGCRLGPEDLGHQRQRQVCPAPGALGLSVRCRGGIPDGGQDFDQVLPKICPWRRFPALNEAAFMGGF